MPIMTYTLRQRDLTIDGHTHDRCTNTCTYLRQKIDKQMQNETYVQSKSFLCIHKYNSKFTKTN